MRRLIALPLLAALVLAACGSTTTTSAPSDGTASGAPSSSVAASSDASVVPSTPLPTATPLVPDASKGPIPSDVPEPTEPPVTPAPSQTAACAKLNDAVDTVDLYLQVFTAVDRTSWSDMTGPDSPVQFDPKKFASAIKTLSQVKGMKAAVASLNEIDRVLLIALKQKDPFAEGVLVGPRLVQLANDNFVLIESALVKARETQGCPQV